MLLFRSPPSRKQGLLIRMTWSLRAGQSLSSLLTEGSLCFSLSSRGQSIYSVPPLKHLESISVTAWNERNRGNIGLDSCLQWDRQAYRGPSSDSLPWARLYMQNFNNGKRWLAMFHVRLSIHVREKPRSAWSTSGSVSASLYHLKLKATHKETLMKAVSPAAYNERMNYGAMATQNSSCCCRNEC